MIVGTFANKLELIAEEQYNAWTSFLLCSTAFNVLPSCGLPVIRCSSNSLPSTVLTYCCYYRGVDLCFIDWPIISIH